MMIKFSDLAFTLVSGALSFTAVTNGFVSALSPKSPDVSDFFEVQSISGTRDGDLVTISLERTIHEPIVMGFTVRIMERNGAGISEFCQMEAQPFTYLPGSVLPEAIDLDWWTHGKCADPPDGESQVWTVWTPEDETLRPIIAVFDIPAK